MSVCLFCQHGLSLTNVARILPRPSQQPLRSLGTLQRRRPPSRMTLSPKVARPVQDVTPAGRPVKKSRNSPFGGMNMTSAQITRMPDQRSGQQIMRSTRGKSFPQKEAPKGNHDTYHALKMQRALVNISYTHRNIVKAKIAEIDSFQQFELLPELQSSIPSQALIGTEELVPTPIQRLVIPALLGMDSERQRRLKGASEGMEQFLIAAETGTGKTLAYLLPVIDAVKRAEAADKVIAETEEAARVKRKYDSKYYVEPPTVVGNPHSTTGRPRAIILVPTSELVEQVTSVLKSLSHTVKFRAAAISASYSPKVIRNRIFSPNGIDVIVTTPYLLGSITESDPNVLSRVTHLIIDEADSLMDRSFAPTTTTIVDKCTSSLKQLILCSATIPKSLDSYLRSRFPDMRRLVTPNLHAIARRVQLGVVDVEKDPYRGNKDLACADTIHTIGKAGADVSAGESADPFAIKRMLVFVNEREKTEELAQYLQTKGIDAVALHRDTGEKRQGALLAQFTTQPTCSPTGEVLPPLVQPTFTSATRRPLLNTKVLVTTDLGSRGIDTLAVRHVILYDVPHSTVDFIHRLGRTGRMGRRGRGIVLVGKGDRRDVVREVREGMFRGQALI